MSSEYKCRGCGAEIPAISVEFGGSHYYTVDGDLYCSKECHSRRFNHDMAIITGPADRYDRWMNGEEVEVDEP